jgi:hypothetical protein
VRTLCHEARWRFEEGTTVKAVDPGQIDVLVARFRGRMDQGKLSAARWAMIHPGQALTLARWIRGLPNATIAPSNDPSGSVLRRRFGGIGLLGTGRHAQAALVLPPSLEQYWRGPKRKVFRNKVAAAGRSGLCWRMLAPEETAETVQLVCDDLGWDREARSAMEALLEIPLESALASATFSADGRALSACLAVASGDVAQVRWAMSVGRGPARWAAFAALLDGASARGVTTILVGPMMGRASEDEYFQRRLGFAPSNIVVSPEAFPSPAAGWRSSVARTLAGGRRWVSQQMARRRAQDPASPWWTGEGTGTGVALVVALLLGAGALAAVLS